MSRIPDIRYRAGDHRAIVTFPYSAMVVERLKVLIPSQYREWTPSQKHWLIVPSHSSELATVLGVVYGDCVVEELPAGTAELTPLRRTIDVAYPALRLIPTVPAELVESSFRCPAPLHHSDRGSFDARTRRLREPAAALRERVKS